MGESPYRIASAALSACWNRFTNREDLPPARLRLILSVAEKLSAGEIQISGSDQIAGTETRVMTVFDRIGADRRNSGSAHYLPLKPLSASGAAIFPVPEPLSDDDAALQRIISEIDAAFQRANQDDEETYVEAALSALHQNAWCVPAPGYQRPCEVSLYDHARITAAIAVCLAALDEAKLNAAEAALTTLFRAGNRAKAEPRDILCEPAALLIGGDVSGIQSFIYTISGDNAAKALRGRSFYLQVLTEILVRQVLKELGLPYTNVIYAGGGNFYILAPTRCAEKLDQVRAKISRKLFKYHGTSLYLSIAAAAVPFSGFQKGAITGHWNAMHRDLALRKQQRYREFGSDMVPMLFDPTPHGGNQEQVCSVCGEEKADTKASDGGDRICASCSSFAEFLGKHLPNTAYIRFTYGDEAECQPGSILNTLAEFGVGLELFDSNGKLSGNVGPAVIDPKRSVLWEIDDPKPDCAELKSTLPTARYRHYVAANVPPMTFDEMQAAIKTGTKRLGVLRMDVDSLGEVFQSGFAGIATLTRISALSFQLSLFFEGHLKWLSEQREHIYTVYTGGDDVFLVGPWQEILALAEAIQERFKAFTVGNPLFHISGGMSFIHGKYPIAQAADDAKEAEDLAKGIDEGKNAFAFLGEAYKWDEFVKIREKKELLTGLGDDLPSSLLQTLQQLDAQQAEAQQLPDRKPKFGRWIWMGEYQLHRMAEQYQKQPQVKVVVDQIRAELNESYYQDLHRWAKAARWAQLATRKE